MSEPLLATDQKERQNLPIDRDVEFVENMEQLIESGQQGMVLNLVMDMHAADLARLLPHLSFEDAQTLFHWLPEEQAGEIIPDLDDEFRAALLEEASSSRIGAIIDELDTDDAADVLADLPEQVVQDVLPLLEDSEDVQELLQYGEETAGGLMNAEYVAVRDNLTVADATDEVRHSAETIDPIYTVYTLDEDGRLTGRVSLKKLLLTQANVPIRAIMNTEVMSVTPDIDQEEVARIMERYDLVALPVVDKDGRLLGRITIDDVVDVIREEAEEDIQRMSGITGDEGLTASVFRISKGRLVWLFVGLVGASLSALVIGRFEPLLDEAVVLTMFIPVVMAMAGNAGIQSSAIAVQGLASGELWASDVPRQLGKEFLVAIINGVAVAIAFGGVIYLMQQTALINVLPGEVFFLALAVGLSLLTVIVLAATIGATVPIMLSRLNIDPAVATGPFITTTNDILGLIIYFFIASLILLPMLAGS